MKSWMLVRFSVGDVAAGGIARLMRELMPLALEIRKQADVGVFSSDLGSEGKCIYFSPGAVNAFAPALAKLRGEPCGSPNPQALSLLYGACECLPRPSEAEPLRVLRVEDRID